MERENKKRGREGEEKKDLSEKSAKKQDLDDMIININFEDSALGVFDFPWLKEGMISKSEDWKIEEDSLSPTFADCSTTVGDEFCLWQTTAAALIDFPEDKFEENAWEIEGGELEGVDNSIWSSLLKQPLEPGV